MYSKLIYLGPRQIEPRRPSHREDSDVGPTVGLDVRGLPLSPTSSVKGLPNEYTDTRPPESKGGVPGETSQRTDKSTKPATEKGLVH